MFTGARHGMGFLGWAATAVVTLAVAAGGSVLVPGLVNAEETPAAATNATVEVNAPAATAAVVAAAPAPEVVAPEVVVPEVEVEVTTPPVTRAAAPKVAAPEPVVTLPPVTLPPITVPALAARTVPTAAQVQSAIAGISSMVQLPLFFQITPANVAQVGNQVCTSFDQGQTFTQVKATGLSMVSAYVAVTPAAADYAVRTAVALYCPAYASKLV
ncbi:MAG: hypothetical protein QOG43_1613 [Actinomycetota bacterium]|jgi:hypothetical protein|nr:hypothetical protein [Actinomycetota bacterium]